MNDQTNEDAEKVEKATKEKRPKSSGKSKSKGGLTKSSESNESKNVVNEDTSTLNGVIDSEPSTSGINNKAVPQLMPEVEKYMKKLILQDQRQEFQFWSTQPVPSIDEDISATINEPIEQNKSINDIRQDPYNLPSGYKWDTLDLKDPEVLQGLYTLLNENYVEDDDNMFRFDYSKEFLCWALMPPGWKREWHVGVRVAKSNRLMGFISAVPATIRIYSKSKDMVEINFLCVHKKLRSKRLAPVLIKEITRRVNLTGIFQAVYTAGVVLPRPVASCRYWHRSLNPKKLIEVKFSHLGKNMTMQRTLKLYKLPDQPQVKGFRKLVPKDAKDCHKLLSEYLNQFDLAPVFKLDEFRHWFLPQDNIIDSFIVENDAGEITDFVSFYTLPSTVMHHPTYKSLKAAYSFYNVSSKTPWKSLMKDALIAARNDNFDVFNALDLMENEQFLSELKFGQGDGNLQYYLYNWRCPSMTPSKCSRWYYSANMALPPLVVCTEEEQRSDFCCLKVCQVLKLIANSQRNKVSALYRVGMYMSGSRNSNMAGQASSTKREVDGTIRTKSKSHYLRSTTFQLPSSQSSAANLMKIMTEVVVGLVLQ